MSDDSTTHETEQDRADRAAALTAATQTLFETGAQGGSDSPESADSPDSPDSPASADSADEPEGDAEEADSDGSGDETAETDEADTDQTEDSDDAESKDADPDQAEDEENADGSEVAAPAAAQPTFGLLFQAPDLSDIPRRRSRRATSGVTTPAPRAAEEESEEGQEPDADDAQDQDSTQDAQAGSSRTSNRRRRGGKGRRGRGGSDTTPETGQDDAESSQADEGDSTDATDTEGQASGSGRSRSRSRSRGSRSGGGGAGGSGSDGGDDSATPAEQDSSSETGSDEQGEGEEGSSSTRRRRRRRRSGESSSSGERSARDQVTSVRGSTRLEAKRQRRREGREAGRRRTIITEAEFLARRESVDRVMVVRGLEDRTQIAVLEDNVPVEHYVSRSTQTTMVGNVYLGRVQNVLPSMEAAFVDIGKGRNAVLYAGEVNWDAAGMVGNEPKRIENALKSGESVLVQVTKDPIGHKGARLTSQISLPGRFLVYVPGSSMTGISRKLPENERTRLKKILKEVLPEDAGVIVRTAAEGASEAELKADVERLTAAWERISASAKAKSTKAPSLLHGEPDMTVRVIRDVFTEDFSKLVVSGEHAWNEVKRYIDDVAPDLAERVEKYTGTNDVFTTYRVSEAIAKAMDRKVWLPSGGSLVIDRTEAMTVVDVNTGKFTGSGGNLEETVTKNNIEAAEEIVRQLRLRDIGGIIVIDFIDMVLESNRDLVVRRLLECLGRDRTKHQVAEVTSLGLVQMTRKRVGSGLIDVFSETCAHCSGRGIIVHTEPLGKGGGEQGGAGGASSGSTGSGNGNNGGNGGGEGNGRRGRGRGRNSSSQQSEPKNVLPTPNPNGPTPAQIAAAAHAAAQMAGAGNGARPEGEDTEAAQVDEVSAEAVAPEPSGEPTTAQESSTGEAPADEPQAGEFQTDGSAGGSAEAPQTDGAAGDGTEASAPAPKKRASRSRGGARTRKATSKVTTPEPAPEVEVVQEITTADAPAPAAPAETAQDVPTGQAPTEQAEGEAPAAPKRRRRGRVSAPAGPPASTDADAATTTQESVPE